MSDSPPAEAAAPWQVPAFTEDVFAPRRSRYAVCLFVINEGERVRSQLRKMAALDSGCDIIIGDGGSKDGSLDAAFLKECGVRALLTNAFSRGAGRVNPLPWGYGIHESCPSAFSS